MLENIRIGVLMGGVSSEREISLKSGRAVFDTLKELNLETVAIDIQKADKNYVTDLLLSYDIGLAFLALHGNFGEDGKIQTILEEIGIPYTGSKPYANALALDKVASRRIFEEAGLSVPKYYLLDRNHRSVRTSSVINRREGGLFLPVEASPSTSLRMVSLSNQSEDEGVAEGRALRRGRATKPSVPPMAGRDLTAGGQAAKTASLPTRDYGRGSMNIFGFPLVIKPLCGGSSIGLSIVDNHRELKEAIDLAFKYDRKVIVEEYIKGREMTVGIFEDKPLEAIEIRPKSSRFFDYSAKYKEGQTEYIVPAELSFRTMSLLKNTALKAHNLLGCFFFSRVDIILSSSQAFILEVNTIPGFTPTSLLPKAALQKEIEFPELILKIAQAALSKYSLNSRHNEGLICQEEKIKIGTVQ